MNSKSSCDSIRKSLFAADLSQPLDTDLQNHVDSCSECKKEYDSLLRMRRLIIESVPDVPELSDDVIACIEHDKITPIPPHKKRVHLPLGTIAAAAAVLAIYVSVYNNGGLSFMLSGMSEDSAVESNEKAQPRTVTDEAEALQESNGSLIQSDSDISDSAIYDAEAFYDAQNGLPEISFYSAERAAGGDNTDSDGCSDSVDGIGFEENSSKAEKNFEVSGTTAETDTESVTSHDDVSALTGGHLASRGSPFYTEANKSSSSDSAPNSDTNAAVDQNKSQHSSGGGVGGALNGSQNISTDGSVASDMSPDDEKTLAETLFEQFGNAYPNRISRELFEQTGPHDFLMFAYTGVEDFETDYTEENLIAFISKNRS